ncbi:hypothetical protein GBA52_028567 [Prunus armeniaca]|nr:hypothetical protein GBA52_028567 [Prunus armeniaca]
MGKKNHWSSVTRLFNGGKQVPHFVVCVLDFVREKCAFFERKVSRMGTEVQSKMYLPGYHSVQKLSSNVGHGSWSLLHENKNLKTGQQYELFLTRPIMDGFHGRDKEQMRQTILKHELVFRHQV